MLIQSRIVKKTIMTLRITEVDKAMNNIKDELIEDLYNSIKSKNLDKLLDNSLDDKSV